MKKEHSGVFKIIPDLKPVDASALAEYEKKMKEEAIPGIIKDVEKRRMLAAESRNRRLETPIDDKSKSPKP